MTIDTTFNNNVNTTSESPSANAERVDFGQAPRQVVSRIGDMARLFDDVDAPHAPEDGMEATALVVAQAFVDDFAEDLERQSPGPRGNGSEAGTAELLWDLVDGSPGYADRDGDDADFRREVQPCRRTQRGQKVLLPPEITEEQEDEDERHHERCHAAAAGVGRDGSIGDALSP